MNNAEREKLTGLVDEILEEYDIDDLVEILDKQWDFDKAVVQNWGFNNAISVIESYYTYDLEEYCIDHAEENGYISKEEIEEIEEYESMLLALFYDRRNLTDFQFNKRLDDFFNKTLGRSLCL